MSYERLKAELLKPAYASLSDQAAADLLNAVSVTVPDHTHRTDLYVLDQLGVKVGEPILAAFAAVASTREAFSVANARLKQGGIDFANASTTAMIDGLVAATVLTQPEGDALIALGTKLISRASQIGLSIVKPGHVQEARN